LSYKRIRDGGRPIYTVASIKNYDPNEKSESGTQVFQMFDKLDKKPFCGFHPSIHR